METEQLKKQSPKLKTFLWILAVLALGFVGYWGSSNLGLFKASVSETGTLTGKQSDNLLYIPNDYTASPSDTTAVVAVRVGGKGFDSGVNITSLDAVFHYNSKKITFTEDGAIVTDGTTFVKPKLSNATIKNLSSLDANGNDKELTIDFLLLPKAPPAPSSTTPLFDLQFAIVAGAKVGDLINLDGTSLTVAGQTSISNVSSTIAGGNILKIIANPTCGDGTKDAGEECDNGLANSDTGACTTACKLAECGDGLVQTGVEQCDDGNKVTEACLYGQTSCTVCDANCHSVAGATSYCGDKIKNGTEQCDTGGDSVSCTAACTTKPKCTDADLCSGWGTCDASGARTRTCDLKPTACDPTGVTPATSGSCACSTANDWKCTDWAPAICPQSGSQTKTCSSTNCTGSGGEPATTQSCTPPAVTNVTNCPAAVPAGQANARPSMIFNGPSGNWKLDGVTTNIKVGAGGGSAAVSNLPVGTHSVTDDGAPCTFTVDCYTSIDVSNARKAIGSTDPAKLLLYDFNSDGKIDATDKMAIYEASKSCN
jgi:hypothetical protein